MRRCATLLAGLCSLMIVGGCKSSPAPAPSPAVDLQPIDPTALDRQVSACDDFYQFACGGWLARTEIPADKPAWSRGFSFLTDRNQELLRAICEADAAGKAEKEDLFADKVGAFYAACMDEAAVEAHGLDELKLEWARIDAIKDADGLVEEIAREHLNGGGAAFNLTADQDAKDARQVIAILMQGGLSLPDRDYYLSKEEKETAIREKFGAHLQAMLGLAGVPAAQAAEESKAIAALETSLAESHWTRTEMRDPIRIYNRVNRDGLEKLAPAFSWERYFKALGAPSVTAVSTTTPKFVERVGKLVTETPIATWRAYLRWHVLSQMAAVRALPKAFVEQNFKFSSESFTGAKELKPRWKLCVESVDGGLGEALGAGYVRRHFGTEGKARTVKLVEEIEKAMGKDIEGLAWMDAATKEQAQKKLAKVTNKIGYPDKWRDYKSMEVGRASHFKNVLAAADFESKRVLAKIGKPVDRGEWFMSPPTVNAYYNPAMNEMVFPAGILQPPFFNRRAPEVVNYGAIGMVVGHELTHGFDDEGRHYDGDGNLNEWWTETVGKEFDTKAKCLVDQYSQFESVPGAKVNGQLTLGENIADLGGLKLSQAAHKAAGDAGKTLDGFTPEQQFFLGYAQSWCFKAREPYSRMLVTLDPHSPPRFRVNGPLSNIPEFAQAFSCQAGSPMARPSEKRCEVW
ncbi:MAG TPA: M13 family metallopeptidase [Myxococcales bacterium]|jgi:endothelin-converting enzyme/putative endopeptidase